MANVIALDATAATEDAWTLPADITDPVNYGSHVSRKVTAEFIGQPLLENLKALLNSRLQSKGYWRTYTCIAGLAVGDPVYISAADTATLATATTVAASRVVGFCRYKPTTTSCYLDHYRYASGLSSLAVGQPVYLSDAGGFSATPGAVPVEMGVALTTTTAILFSGPRTLSATAPRPNALINGGFRVSQRGDSFTSATIPANNDDTYLLDRWLLLSDGSDIVDVAKSSVVPDGAYASIQLDVETANKKFGILQILENRDTVALFKGSAGVVSLSFDAKVTDARIGYVKAAVIAWGGAEDAVTSDLIAAWNAENTTPTLVANWTMENTPAGLGVTTSWARYRIDGIALDTAGTTNIAVLIWSDDTTVDIGDKLHIARVKLESHEYATEYIEPIYADEVDRCQRYFFGTFNGAGIGSSTGQNTGAIEAVPISNDQYSMDKTFFFPRPMRAAPTITTYNPGAAGSGWRDIDTPTDRAFDSDFSLAHCVQMGAGAAVTGDQRHRIHLTADAEL